MKIFFINNQSFSNRILYSLYSIKYKFFFFQNPTVKKNYATFTENLISNSNPEFFSSSEN